MTTAEHIQVGDHIRGFGTITARYDINGRGRGGRLIEGPFFATDTGYHMLNFPPGRVCEKLRETS